MPNYLTLSDVAQQTHNKELLPMVQEIEKPTTLFASMGWQQSSDSLSDVTGVQGEIPHGTWVGLDRGVKANKGTWSQREEGMGLLEAWSEVNEKTMSVSPNPDALRWENDQMHLQGMGEDAEFALLYGNPLQNPNTFLGFMPRFGYCTDWEGNILAGEHQGENSPFICIDAGGAEGKPLSSILLVASGAPQGPRLIYPRYKENNGIVFRHFPFENTLDAEGGNIRVAKSQFMIMMGLKIPHRRSVIRIANIDPTDATVIEGLSNKLYEAFEAMPLGMKGSVNIYTTGHVTLAMRKSFNERVMPAKNADAVAKNAIGDVNFDNFILQRCYSMLGTEDHVI
jgi:hypothetical protein